MTNKEFKHTQISDKHKCRICNKPIKLRLVKIKEIPPTLCYNHFIAKRFKNPGKKEYNVGGKLIEI